MDNSCKRRVYCLYHSFILIHTERDQYQASLTWEKSACLTEISVTDRLYGNFQVPKILGELIMRKQCVPGSFLSAREPGNEARVSYDTFFQTMVADRQKWAIQIRVKGSQFS